MEDTRNEDSIPILLAKISHAYFGLLFHQMTDAGLHPGQVPIIKLLYEEENLSQKEIAARLHVKPPTVNVSIRRLEQTGMVRRSADAEDQRVTRIHLTEKGRDLEARIRRTVQENEKILLSGFSETELCLAKRFLEQMLENLRSVPGNDWPCDKM